MSKKQKVLSRLLTQPSDFTWQELKTLMTHLGYKEYHAGSTSGLRVRFIQENCSDIMLHKPHPLPILKKYQIKQIINCLEKEGLI